MATYDLLMLAILVGLTLYGYFKGMAWQIAYVASFVASYFLAVRFADRIAPYVTQYTFVQHQRAGEQVRRDGDHLRRGVVRHLDDLPQSFAR